MFTRSNYEVPTKMETLQSQMDCILKKYPQFDRLYEDEEYPDDLNEYDHAHFVCTQLYHQYGDIFIPIMLPGGEDYLFEGRQGVYGHTHTDFNKNGEPTKIWTLIKFTPHDVMNRELTGKITFSKR